MRLAAIAVFESWLVITGLVFSFMSGIFHQYYTVALSPACTLLAAVCTQGIWDLRHHIAARIAGALLSAASAAWTSCLVAQSGDLTWLAIAIAVPGTASAAVVLTIDQLTLSKTRQHQYDTPTHSVVRAAIAVACAALHIGPAYWIAGTISTGHHGSIVTDGPSTQDNSGGGQAPNNGGEKSDSNAPENAGSSLIGGSSGSNDERRMPRIIVGQRRPLAHRVLPTISSTAVFPS